MGGGGNSPEVGIGVMGGPGTGRYGDVGVGGGLGGGGYPGWVCIEVVGDLEGRIRSGGGGGNSPEVGIGVIGGPRGW